MFICSLRCKMPQHGIQSSSCSEWNWPFQPYILMPVYESWAPNNFPRICWVLGSQKYPGNWGEMVSRFVNLAMICPAPSSWHLLPLIFFPHWPSPSPMTIPAFLMPPLTLLPPALYEQTAPMGHERIHQYSSFQAPEKTALLCLLENVSFFGQ